MSGDAQRRLILHMAVSLDGFVARSDGVIDWLSTRRPGGVDHGDHRHHANLEMLGQIGLVVLGRRAYEEMAPAWSSSDGPMARILNALPKIVFAHGGSEVEWNAARATDGPIEQEIPRLKREPGHDIVAFGGGHFAHSLIRARLVDEYRLTVHPPCAGRRHLAHARPARATALRAHQQHRLRGRLRRPSPRARITIRLRDTSSPRSATTDRQALRAESRIGGTAGPRAERHSALHARSRR
jgi:dihydrofolate reductase